MRLRARTLLSDLGACVPTSLCWLWLSAAWTLAVSSDTGKAAAPAVASPVTALAIAPNGKSVMAGSQAGLRQLSWPELKAQGTLKTLLAHVHDLAFSPRGDFLAVAGGAPAEAGIVELFSWPDGKLKYRAEPQGDLIYAVAWSPDGRRLATASYDHSVAILDASTGKRLHKLQGHSRGVLAVCYLPDGKTLVSAGADNSLRVWDAESGRAVRTLDNHTAAVHDLAVRPSEAKDAPPLVASVSDDRTVRLWQPTIGRMVRFARLPSAPLAVAWSADGKQLVVACADGHVRAIDPETLDVLAEAKTVDGRAISLAVPSDGNRDGDRILVGGSDGQLRAVTLEVLKWGHLSGQFLFDGEPPPPRTLRVTTDRETFGETVPDESLLVHPKSRGVANVVVYILPKMGEKLAVHPTYDKTAKDKVILAAQQGRFQPHVVLMRTSQVLLQEERDRVPVSIHIASPRDFGVSPYLPPGNRLERRFDRGEVAPLRILSNIYPWMHGHLLVRDEPYIAKTDEHGRFRIDNLPLGTHTFQFWHERSGYVREFTFSLRGQRLSATKRARAEVTIEPSTNDLGAIRLRPELFADKRPAGNE